MSDLLRFEEVCTYFCTYDTHGHGEHSNFASFLFQTLYGNRKVGQRSPVARDGHRLKPNEFVQFVDFFAIHAERGVSHTDEAARR